MPSGNVVVLVFQEKGLHGKKSDLATDTGPEQDQSSDLRQITRKWHRQSANCKEDTQDRE